MAVIVEFAGICTHIRRNPRYKLPVPHRVILIDNSNGDHGIHPHHASLSIRSADLRLPNMYAMLDGWLSWMLHGVCLSIEQDGQDVQYDDWDKVPKLPSGLQPHDAVALKGEEVAAWFDFTGGTFRPVCHGKATGVQVEIDVINPSLVMRTFDGRIEASLPLRSDAQIRVQNTAAPMHHHDDNRHFLLHYRIARESPDKAPKPDECTAPRGTPSIHGPIALGAGCSNSTWP